MRKYATCLDFYGVTDSTLLDAFKTTFLAGLKKILVESLDKEDLVECMALEGIHELFKSCKVSSNANMPDVSTVVRMKDEMATFTTTKFTNIKYSTVNSKIIYFLKFLITDQGYTSKSVNEFAIDLALNMGSLPTIFCSLEEANAGSAENVESEAKPDNIPAPDGCCLREAPELLCGKAKKSYCSLSDLSVAEALKDFQKAEQTILESKDNDPNAENLLARIRKLKKWASEAETNPSAGLE